MPISTLPEFPAIGDSAFNSKAYAFGTAMTGTFRTDINALEANVNAKEASTTAQASNAAASAAAAAASAAFNNATGTSTSSVLIATGAKSFTTDTGRSWVAGQALMIRNSDSNYMVGTVTSYSGAALVVNVLTTGGSGTLAAWSIYAFSSLHLPILSSVAAGLNASSNLEDIYNSTPGHGFGSVIMQSVRYGGGQFCLFKATSSGTVVTSPDGTTWTSRTLPSSGVWHGANNGSNFLAVQASSTTTAKSTNGGVTWASATVLPAASYSSPRISYTTGGVCLVTASTTTGYVSTDNGTTWSAVQTLPGTNFDYYSVGAYLVAHLPTTGATYYSTTGLTGSWTASTTLTAGMSIKSDGNGGLVAVDSTNTPPTINAMQTTNGTTWSSLGFTTPTPSAGLFSINGVWCAPATGNPNTFGNLFTRHNGNWVLRNSVALAVGGYNANGIISNGAGVWVAVNNGSTSTVVGRIEPSAATAKTGLFSAI